MAFKKIICLFLPTDKEVTVSSVFSFGPRWVFPQHSWHRCQVERPTSTLCPRITGTIWCDRQELGQAQHEPVTDYPHRISSSQYMGLKQLQMCVHTQRHLPPAHSQLLPRPVGQRCWLWGAVPIPEPSTLAELKFMSSRWVLAAGSWGPTSRIDPWTGWRCDSCHLATS